MDCLFPDEVHYAFGAITLKNRFEFLLSNITFDNYIDREKNWPTDRFSTMRPVRGLFSLNLDKYVAPSEYLTIDETLYSMRHQIALRQYNPNKPHKYGVLLKSLNDARFRIHIKLYHMQLNQLLVLDHFTYVQLLTTSKILLFKQWSKLDFMEEIFPWIVCTLVLKSLTSFLRKTKLL